MGWWRETQGGYTLANVAGRFVAGDFNNDDRDDVATFYDYGSGNARIHVWLSTGSSFSYDPPGSGQLGWWRETQGGYTLANVADRMVTGYFDDDDLEDVATFYDYDNGNARIHVWLSTGSSFSYNSPEPGGPQMGWWREMAGGYPLANVGGRFVPADLNGDLLDDVAAFYDYGSGAARIHVWLSDSVRFNYNSPEPGGPQMGWWRISSGYSLGQVAGRMVAGAFDGR